MNRCTATTRDGAACKAEALPGRTLCMFHDPAAAEARSAGRQEGGRRRSTPRKTLGTDTPPVEVRSVRDVCALLGETIHHVRTGQLDPKIANTVGYLASVMIRAIEAGEMEQRLAALEAAVNVGWRAEGNEIDRDPL